MKFGHLINDWTQQKWRIVEKMFHLGYIVLMSSTEEFASLDLGDKVKLLYEQGEFVMSIRYYDYKVNLFLLNNHYFEVFYHHKHDKIEKIHFLDQQSTRMNFYVDQIRLTNLA